MVCLPPNTTHALCPLDVGVFFQLKQEWRLILRQWYSESRLQSVGKCVFPKLLARLWGKLDSTIIANSFSGAGLYPLNIKKPARKLLLSQQSSTEAEAEQRSSMPSPYSHLRNAILNRLPPEKSSPIAKKRKRLDNTCGRILSDKAALNQMSSMKVKGSAKDKQKSNSHASTETDSLIDFDPVSPLKRTILGRKLGYRVRRMLSLGSPSLLSPPHRCHRTRGDGNCFFRAVSYSLSGTEDLHGHFRLLVTDFMKKTDGPIQTFLHGNATRYVEEGCVQESGVWATETEILAMAALIGIDILVWAQYGTTQKWLRYPASLSFDEPTNDALFLNNGSGIHFDAVLS